MRLGHGERTNNPVSGFYYYGNEIKLKYQKKRQHDYLINTKMALVEKLPIFQLLMETVMPLQ